MNALFLVFLIVEAIFGIGFLFAPGLMMDPMGVTLDETSTTFARMVGSLIISLTVLLFFARKSASSEFKGGVVYSVFVYLFVSTIILLIAQVKGLMNPMGWSIVIMHLVFFIWFGYYFISMGKMDSSR
ncbi:MAG: hypothetical protein RBU28_10395 [Bacteroidales bacterium]|jgi:hypothetical protein|nr:hypothetical protein [Bacteroidales bacterium]